MRTPAIERLLSRCVQDGDCWIYMCTLDRFGYVRLRDDDGVKQFGHWIAW